MHDWDDDGQNGEDEDDFFDTLSQYSNIDAESDDFEGSEADFEFELKFYTEIAGTPNFQVLVIPDADGYIPTRQEMKGLKQYANKKGLDLIYRISQGNIAVVFGPRTGKVGIVPTYNPQGFPC